MANQVLLVGGSLGQDVVVSNVVVCARARSLVPLADVSQVRRASTSLVHSDGRVDGSAGCERSGREGCGDRCELVALEQDPGVLVNVKGMAVDVLEIVVDKVVELLRGRDSGTNVRCAAGQVVEPVTDPGVLVIQAGHESRPVVLAVAAGRPGGAAVKLVVGDGDTAGLAPAAHDELAADEGDLWYFC